jgi:hypothetical protein
VDGERQRAAFALVNGSRPDFPGSARTPCPWLGVKGSRVQIPPSRPERCRSELVLGPQLRTLRVVQSQIKSHRVSIWLLATTARRRGYGEDSIYFDAANSCWTAAVSLGHSPDGRRRIRRKVTGKTKTAVRDKLKVRHRELEAGIQSSASYTMALCIEDWLSQGLSGRSASTIANYASRPSTSSRRSARSG